MPAEKSCSCCRKLKSTDQFYKSSSSNDGLQHYCKECSKPGNRPPVSRRKAAMQQAEALFAKGLKCCSKCNSEKPLDAFHRATKSWDGLVGNCKPCQTERERAWRKANPGRSNARSNRWRNENRDRVNANRRLIYKKDPERARTYRNRWRDENREHYLAVKVSHEARRRALIAGSSTTQFTENDLAARWSYYGNKCWICGDTATATDHVKPISKGGPHILSNLRPICKPCNSRKRNTWPITEDLLERIVG